MPLKFSEMIALRVDLARNLEAGFDNYLEDIAEGYSDFVAPLLEEGESAPDIRLQLEILKRGVARGRERLRTIGGGVVEQTHEDDKVRAELERRQDRVGDKLRLVRHVCRGFFGASGVERVGLRKEPPRGAVRLLEQAQMVKASLEKPDLGLEPLIELETGEGVATPQAQLASELEPELSELAELVGDRHHENRKNADVRSRQRRMIREFDRDVRAIVRMAQGMFRLAGRDDLAERFRPILRRVIRRINKAGPPPSEGTSQPDTADLAAESEPGAAPEASDGGPEPAPAPKSHEPAS